MPEFIFVVGVVKRKGKVMAVMKVFPDEGVIRTNCARVKAVSSAILLKSSTTSAPKSSRRLVTEDGSGRDFD